MGAARHHGVLAMKIIIRVCRQPHGHLVPCNVYQEQRLKAVVGGVEVPSKQLDHTTTRCCNRKLLQTFQVLLVQIYARIRKPSVRIPSSNGLVRCTIGPVWCRPPRFSKLPCTIMWQQASVMKEV